MASIAWVPAGSFAYAASVARHLWRRANEHRLVGLASQSAFWLSLALVPLAAVSGMFAASRALSHSDLGPIFSNVPIEGRTWLATELAKVASFRAGEVAPYAAAVFVWLASSGVHGLFDAFEAQCRCAERPWWKKRLLAIVCCLALAVGAGLIAYVAAGLDTIVAAVGGDRLPASSAAGGVLRFAFGVCVDAAMTAGLFAIGLDRVERVPLLPGVILATLLHLGLGGVYALFIHRLGDSGAYLAGLAVVAVTMTAMFFYTLALLTGLALNTVLADHPPPRRRGARYE